MKRRNAMILGLVWLLVMVCIAASTVTLLVSGGSAGGTHWVSESKYEMIERYARLEQVRSALEEGYYQEVDDDALMTAAIRGMMASLEDPYTFYYTPDEMEEHNEQTEGTYHGIGILMQSNADGQIEIIRVYEGSPAAASGARAGDFILRVDGVEVSGTDAQAFEEAVNLMRGEDGTELALTVQRDGGTLELHMIRGDVSVSNVSYAELSGGIGYINIFQFTGDDVTAFDAALEALQAAGVSGLMIDLRNNPGGLLDDVVAIADRLLPEGLIVYTEDRAGKRESFYSDAACCDLPLVILINDMSASASEILAAAVQDHGRGTLVGTQSYGKGIVQTVVRFEEDGAGMQFTSSCYYTPSGKNIHGTGVTPDIEVEAGDGGSFASGILNPEEDAQLRTALEALEALMDAEN